MLEEAIDLGEQDLEERLLISARNDAEQILGALRKQLGEYGRLINAGERARMDEVAERLEAARTGTDRELIAKLVEDLNEVTTPFAERIMDAAIKLALEKKSVEELSEWDHLQRNSAEGRTTSDGTQVGSSRRTGRG